LRKRKQYLLAIGAFLALVAILLALSFHLVDNHSWYWNAAPILCAVGILSAASGGFMTGYSLAQTQKRRWWLVALGGILALAWLISGMMAESSAFSLRNYFPFADGYIGWDSYYGDYIVGLFHIWALQLATATGLVGGFSTGFGLGRK